MGSTLGEILYPVLCKGMTGGKGTLLGLTSSFMLGRRISLGGSKTSSFRVGIGVSPVSVFVSSSSDMGGNGLLVFSSVRHYRMPVGGLLNFLGCFIRRYRDRLVVVNRRGGVTSNSRGGIFTSFGRGAVNHRFRVRPGIRTTVGCFARRRPIGSFILRRYSTVGGVFSVANYEGLHVLQRTL